MPGFVAAKSGWAAERTQLPSCPSGNWGSVVAERYPCPCCGHLVFEDPPGSYEICPVCFWEDEPLDGGGRLIDLSLDHFESWESETRIPWPSDKTSLYWWRPTFWSTQRPFPKQVGGQVGGGDSGGPD